MVSDSDGVGALAANNRLTRTSGVIRAYTTIMSAHRGEVPCTVTTAKVALPFIGLTYIAPSVYSSIQRIR